MRRPSARRRRASYRARALEARSPRRPPPRHPSAAPRAATQRRAPRRPRRPRSASRGRPAPATTTTISPRTPLGRPRRRARRGCRADLLVQLRQLPADDRAASAPNAVGHVGERGGEPVRRLEEHHRAPLARQRRASAPAPLALAPARQEPLEGEPVGRQPRHGERRQHGGRPRDRGDGHPGAPRPRDQREARVARPSACPHPRRARTSASARELRRARAARPLVVVVQRDQARPVRRRRARRAGAARPGCPPRATTAADPRVSMSRGASVAEVADRRRREDDHAPSLPVAGDARPIAARAVSSSLRVAHREPRRARCSTTSGRRAGPPRAVPAAAIRPTPLLGALGAALVLLVAAILPALEPRLPQASRVRRDLLREGRLDPRAPRLRGHLAGDGCGRQALDVSACSSAARSTSSRPTAGSSRIRRSASGSSASAWLAGGAQNPFGWRIAARSSACSPCAAHARRARCSVHAARHAVAGGLMAIDGHAIVMSRVALLDNFGDVLRAAGFACVLDGPRLGASAGSALWLDAAAAGRSAPGGRRCSGGRGCSPPVSRSAPAPRVKWSGLYFLAVLRASTSSASTAAAPPGRVPLLVQRRRC